MIIKASMTRADKFVSQRADGQRRHRERLMRVTIGRFNTIIAVVRSVAQSHGYAVAVHGSLLRDIDLLAVPWISKVKAPSTLVKAILPVLKNATGVANLAPRNPSIKPHGRLAWSIEIGGGTYIDLSVMPRKG